MTSLTEVSEVLPDVVRVVGELLDALRGLPIETLQHDATVIVRSQTNHGMQWSFPRRPVVRRGIAADAPEFERQAREAGAAIARCCDLAALVSVGYPSDETACGKAVLVSAVDALIAGVDSIPAPSSETIAETCAAIVDGFRRRQIDVEFVVPLFTLKNVLRPVTLAPGVTLLPATDRERIEFIENFHRESSGITFNAGSLEAVLSIVEPRLPNEPHAVTERQSRTLDLFVRAQALAGAGAPQLVGHWLRVARPSPFRLMSGGMWDTAQQGALYDPVALDADRAALLTRVFCALEACPKELIYSLPMRRFIAAHRRETTSDQVVDVWVALEAILAGNERGELTHRMRLRAGCLLATADPAAFRKAFNDAYGERSTLVHGRVSPNAKAAHSANEALQWAYDVLRRLLLRAVAEKKFWDPAAIDDAMIAAGAGKLPQSASDSAIDWRHIRASPTSGPDLGAMASAGGVLTREGIKTAAYVVNLSRQWLKRRIDRRGN